MSQLLSRLSESMPWLDKSAAMLKQVSEPLVGPDAPPKLKDALYGTWHGHPLHPPITDIPIGAWTATAILDLLGQERAADATLKIGVAGAVGSAITGIAQWYDLQNMDEPRRLGAMHASLNSWVLTLYLTSWALRSKGNRGAGIATAMAGYSIAGFSGWIGGHLAYVLGIGVSRVAFETPPTEWTDVAPVLDVPDGELVRAELDGVPVVILREGDSVYAVSNTCTHVGGPLNEGDRDGTCVTCPWHGSTFDLRDGSVIHGPATAALDTLDGRIMDGQVQLRGVAK